MGIKNSRLWITITACVLWGISIWVFSSVITGRREPWDAGGLYRNALIISGIISALALPKYFWAGAAGLWLGQVIGLLTSFFLADDPGGLWPIGIPIAIVIFIPLYSLWGVLGSFIGIGIIKITRKKRC